MDKTPNQRLKERIETLMAEGQTLKDIAAAAGVKYQTIGQILKGQVGVPREIIPMSYGLGMTPEEVWYGTSIDPLEQDIMKRLRGNPVALAAMGTLLKLHRDEPTFSAPHGNAEWQKFEGLHDADVGLCYIGSDLKYAQLNQAIADMNGYSIEDCGGESINDIIPHVAAVIGTQLRQVMETRRPIVEGSIRAETGAAPGQPRIFTHSFRPVLDDTVAKGVVCVVREPENQE